MSGVLQRVTVLILGLMVLASARPTPLAAMEVTSVQGGCEPSLAHKLIRRASGALERCKATGHVMVHVLPDGTVQRVDADLFAKACLMARMATWHVKMREAKHCVLELLTAQGRKFLKDQAKIAIPAGGSAGRPMVLSTAPAGVDAAAATGKAAGSAAQARAARKAAIVAQRAEKKARTAAKRAEKKAGLAAKRAEKKAALGARKAEKKAALAAKKAERKAKAAARKAALASRKAAKKGTDAKGTPPPAGK